MLGLEYLNSSDDEVLESRKDEEDTNVLDSNEHRIISSEKKDGDRGVDIESSPVGTESPRNKPRDVRLYPDFGITRYNGKRECDWASAKLFYKPRVKAKLNKLEATVDIESSPVGTESPGNKPGDVRPNPDTELVITRYNGKREGDWASARLFYKPRVKKTRNKIEAPSSLSATPIKHVVVNGSNMDICQKSVSPCKIQVTPEAGDTRHHNSDENIVLSERGLRQYATGKDPSSGGEEGFACSNSERSVCRTGYSGIPQSHRRLCFDKGSHLITTHPAPTNERDLTELSETEVNERELTELSETEVLLDRYQEDAVPLHGGVMNYDDIRTLKNHPKRESVAEPRRDINTDDKLKDQPMLKQTSGEGQDILVGEIDSDYEDSQVDDFIRGYTSKQEEKGNTSSGFSTRETSNEVPSPQRRKADFPSTPTRPHTAQVFRRITATLPQYCGGGCARGIREGDFIEKLNTGLVIGGEYRGWKHWDCEDNDGLTFNWKIHGGVASSQQVASGQPVPQPQTSPSVTQPHQGTENTEAAANPEINTRNTSNTSTGLQFNCWSPQQRMRAEASKREAFKRRNAGGTQKRHGKGGLTQSNQYNKAATAKGERLPTNNHASSNNLLQAATTNPPPHGKVSQLQLKPEEHTKLGPYGKKNLDEKKEGNDTNQQEDIRDNGMGVHRKAIIQLNGGDVDSATQVSKSNKRSYENEDCVKDGAPLNGNRGQLTNTERSASRGLIDNKSLASLDDLSSTDNHNTTSEDSYAGDSWLKLGGADDASSGEQDLGFSSDQRSENSMNYTSESSEEEGYDIESNDDSASVGEDNGNGSSGEVGVQGCLRRSARLVNAITQPRYTEADEEANEPEFSDDYRDDEYEEYAFGDDNDSDTSRYREYGGQDNSTSLERKQLGERGASNFRETEDSSSRRQMEMSNDGLEASSVTEGELTVEIDEKRRRRTTNQQTTTNLSNRNDPSEHDNRKQFKKNEEQTNGDQSPLRGGRSGGGDVCTMQTTIPQTFCFHLKGKGK